MVVVSLVRSNGQAITPIFVDDVMFSHNGINTSYEIKTRQFRNAYFAPYALVSCAHKCAPQVRRQRLKMQPARLDISIGCPPVRSLLQTPIGGVDPPDNNPSSDPDPDPL